MNRRQELIDACERGDRPTVQRLGWDDNFETLRDGWWSRDPFTVAQLTPYAKLLGHYPPDTVRAAITDAAGKWRPRPGELLAAVRAHSKTNATAGTNAGRNRNPATRPNALAATLEALHAGARVCECSGPTSIRWTADTQGVWRCPTCDGLEQGQVYAAEDAQAEAEAKAVSA